MYRKKPITKCLGFLGNKRIFVYKKGGRVQATGQLLLKEGSHLSKKAGRIKAEVVCLAVDILIEQDRVE